ncbi:MAG: GGDEF domain-containing protein [Betaproteobacteria bacterium]|nr:GGDEF domain-containing protein [Betaproteobacteria bacterium]
MNAIQIDLNTLLVVTIANITALAIVSPAVMGWKISVAARSAQLSLFFYAISWIPMILSNLWPGTLADRFLSTISVGGFAASNWMLFKAMSHWLGPRRFERTVKLLIYLIPVGYCILFDDYSIRVGWANFLLAIQMFLLAFACLRPAKSVHGDWRMVVAFGMCAMAILTLGRGLLGAFTDSYPSFLTPHPWNVIAMFMTSLLPLMVNYALLGGWHEEAEIAMHDQAITDAMTGLYNRRGWVEIGQPLVANANRQNDSMALLMFDIDYFKKINDTHGHDAGDTALQALGGLLLAHRRENDVAARVGGEEFCLLLPGCTLDSAIQIEKHLREQLLPLATRLGFPVNFSCGLAMRQPGETLERIMRRADTAMYKAKECGRGRLEIAP